MYSDNSLDGKSKQKAFALFESGLIGRTEIETVKGLLQIHAYLFGGLYDFAEQIRTVNIAKGGFAFAPARFQGRTLERIETMPESDIGSIVEKYAEMNVAHPFREGNRRAMRRGMSWRSKPRDGVLTVSRVRGPRSTTSALPRFARTCTARPGKIRGTKPNGGP